MSESPLMLKALRFEDIPRPPVWLMRQAGRYMKEYRALKERYTFLELCRSPELAVEVSLQPMKEFDMDASIIFADILLPLEPMGIGIDFNPGPSIENKIKTSSDVKALKTKDVAEQCSFVGQAINSLKKELNSNREDKKTILGFAGAPWTLACYILDQGPLKNFAGSLVFANQNPEATKLLLNKLTDVIEEYLLMQIEAGADAVQLFDTWAGLLPEKEFRDIAFSPAARIIEKIKKTGTPIIYYANGASHLIPAMLETAPNCIGIDSRTPLGETIELAKVKKIAVQGNYEAGSLFKSAESVKEETEKMLSNLSNPTGYITNLGHGVLQRTPIESVRSFVDTVKNSSATWK